MCIFIATVVWNYLSKNHSIELKIHFKTAAEYSEDGDELNVFSAKEDPHLQVPASASLSVADPNPA